MLRKLSQFFAAFTEDNMKILLFIALCIAASNAVPSVIEEWSSFKSRHGKAYSSPVEEQFRFGVYMSNKEMIEEHNEKYKAGLVSFEMKLNHFADKLQDEISAEVNGFNSTGQLLKRRPGLKYLQSNANVPSSIDWRKLGAVTQVKNQGQCGSCWAFSTTGSLEGQMFRKTGKLVSLSEQNLVDCAGEEYGNNGCDGGLMDQAFDYIRDNQGIDTEESYPYEGHENNCRFRKSNVAGSVRSYVDIPSGDEEALKRAVATVGPISVAINAGLHSFSFYSRGVYNDKSCDKTLNHGVLLVGYGTENGQDFWLVKNSWSSRWGEDGYVKIARNQRNLCGIAAMASYPVV